jgi:hypothetical protein
VVFARSKTRLTRVCFGLTQMKAAFGADLSSISAKRVLAFRMKQRLFDILAHGSRMRADALASTGDVNAAYFLVHGVVAQAMDNKQKPTDAVALNQAMRHSICAWRTDTNRTLKRA